VIVTASSFLNGGVSGAVDGGACFTGEGCFFTGFLSGGIGFTGTQSFTATSPYESPSTPGTFNYFLSLTVEVDLSSIPEPSTFVLGGTVLLGLAAWRRRSRA
jgi:hypothetical protein